MLEPNEEDEIWRNQQDWNPINWKLHNFCGVHVLLMDTGFVIHMMVEKKYPLSQDTLSKMMSRRLEVDHQSEMGYELIRLRRYKKLNDLRVNHKFKGGVLGIMEFYNLVLLKELNTASFGMWADRNRVLVTYGSKRGYLGVFNSKDLKRINSWVMVQGVLPNGRKYERVLKLLKRSLISRTPLADTFIE
ncbi:hypothetical protein Tco_0656653 [Tanacetum coccineum]|uniref:Uncharacterized protein n=1 Tax=Tanacetum coccineum TaxID=301880 RepID=A0ABQ4X9D9_9ASTR